MNHFLTCFVTVNATTGILQTRAISGKRGRYSYPDQFSPSSEFVGELLGARVRNVRISLEGVGRYQLHY